MSTNIVKHMDKIRSLEALAEQQQTEITSMKHVIYALQKEVASANMCLHQLANRLCEVEHLTSPLKEENKRQQALAKAKAEIEAAERTIESARKIIANGGEEEGYW